ncbi:DnaA/Hda family protein [Enterovirga sp.]|jgi:chromosomal replication initiation ATPase DnaA|uniref:DnaA/Hda family protein n=1 Tax=Enterovirga sp. TaxID=2026350 RepID=UPI002629775C|nr:DnaA/Hda family protein [Enterovirga sp.]MDB5591722.1 Chromosomal replication initiator DnaA [Enterovirga sp.]
MLERGRQLAFDLPVRPQLGIEDFLVGLSNESAFDTIVRWPDWPGPLMHLRGARGSGKSHLAAIWAERAGAETVAAGDVGRAAVPALAAQPAIVLEDLDRGPVDEPALFHLVNLVRERGGSLLVTSAAAVDGCGLVLPDLLSRLRLAPSLAIDPPDDDLLRAVLVKLFVDRQLVVDASVVSFVAARIERSFEAAAAAVARLDREALSRGRRVTRPMAADILPQDGRGDEA